jgi:hypothetical protein
MHEKALILIPLFSCSCGFVEGAQGWEGSWDGHGWVVRGDYAGWVGDEEALAGSSTGGWEGLFPS